MKTVLIVSPHFPPINAPDMQRVRMSLPYFEKFGWKPIVLAIDPNYVEGVKEPLLIQTIPSHIPIYRVPALPNNWTRKIGLGSVAIRALPFLYRKGCELVKKYNVDLIYFSTTLFPAMPLGRVWKSKFNIPFVLDIQDPWVSDYKQDQFTLFRSPKHWLMRKIHRISEPWTMKKVDGLISVSTPYLEVLTKRYPRLEKVPKKTITFSGSVIDFEVLQNNPQSNHFFKSDDQEISIVYAGAGGHDLGLSMQIIFQAFSTGLKQYPFLFSKIRMYFVGTSYASANIAIKTIEPIANQFGLLNYVTENPQRIPYFQTLQLLRDADLLLIPGLEDPQYTASKIFPYILAKKPLIAVFHELSSIVKIIKLTNAGFIISFKDYSSIDKCSDELKSLLNQILPKLPFSPDTDWQNFNEYSAQAMTEKQCNLFTDVIKCVINDESS